MECLPPQGGGPRLARLRRRRGGDRRRRRDDYQRDEDLGTGESGRAEKVIAAGFADHAGEQVLVQSRDPVTLEDPRFQAALDDVEHRLGGFPSVINVETPRAHGASLVSRDRRSTLRSSTSSGTRRSPATGSRRCSRRSRARRPHTRSSGSRSSATPVRAISQAFEDHARRAEFLSLPITLLILVAAFGALVAAGIPLLLG